LNFYGCVRQPKNLVYIAWPCQSNKIDRKFPIVISKSTEPNVRLSNIFEHQSNFTGIFIWSNSIEHQWSIKIYRIFDVRLFLAIEHQSFDWVRLVCQSRDKFDWHRLVLLTDCIPVLKNTSNLLSPTVKIGHLRTLEGDFEEHQKQKQNTNRIK